MVHSAIVPRGRSCLAGALAAGFAGPKLKGAQRPLAPGWADHLDQSCRAAHQRRPTGGLVGVLGECPHERQINMHVRIDKARENKFPAGIDDLGARRRRDVLIDSCDSLVLTKDVGDVALIVSNNFSILNKQWHRFLPFQT